MLMRISENMQRSTMYELAFGLLKILPGVVGVKCVSLQAIKPRCGQPIMIVAACRVRLDVTMAENQRQEKRPVVCNANMRPVTSSRVGDVVVCMCVSECAG